MDSNSTFPLSPDTYTLSVTYLTDIEMCERCCSDMGYKFEEWVKKDLPWYMNRCRV